jgi:8-oxo-dGTP pyrophosphatase MutT (NUDIX family)
VVLLDDAGRVLLFRIVDPQEDKPPVWITPGGGVERGEDLAVAAARELREETGVVVAPAALGAPVAVCRGAWSFRGLPLYSVDWLFAFRTAAFEPDDSEWSELERELHCDWRWWSSDDIDGAEEIILPDGLGPLVRDLVLDRRPAEPVELPWREV